MKTQEHLTPFPSDLAVEGSQDHESIRALASRGCVALSDALRDMNDPLMPTRAHGLISLKRLIEDGEEAVLRDWKHVLRLLEASLADTESYIYLSAINTLAALASIKTEQVLPILLQAFECEDRTLQERLNVAEAVARVSKSCDQSTLAISSLAFPVFLRSATSGDDVLRVSSLSNLGFLCARLGSSLAPFLEQVMHVADHAIRNDPSRDVRRAALLMLQLMLTGMQGSSFEVRVADVEQLVLINSH